MKLMMLRRMVTLLGTSGLIATSSPVLAAAFQLWEQSGAGVGNDHAGYAAIAEDASTSFYNPAGLTRFKTQQAVFSAIGITTDFKFKGKVSVNTVDNNAPMWTTAQGGTYATLPGISYVAPLSDRFAFGFSVGVPFGLKTNYGSSTPLRYAATKTSVQVLDVSPALAVQLTQGLSLGAGYDVQFMKAEFDEVAVLGTGGDVPSDTLSRNRLTHTGYGYHLGALYQFTPCVRMGLSYHSQVSHHLKGRSSFRGPLAEMMNDGYHYASRATSRVTLPDYTALSIYGNVHPDVALMGTVIYTGWDTFKHITLHHVSGISDFSKNQNLTIDAIQNYKNTWQASVGADYYANDRLMLRTGVGFDETPLRNAYRNVQLPDVNRYVVAFGGRYLVVPCVRVDLDYAHVFAANRAKVHPPLQITGDESIDVHGNVKGGADVYAVQVTWDMT